MKKVLSIIACAILCAFMLVSCGPSLSYPKEMETMGNAFKNNDFKTVLANAKVIINGQDKATAEELLCSSAYAYASLACMTQEGQTLEVGDALVISKQIVSGFEQSKAKNASLYKELDDKLKPVIGISFDEIVSVIKTSWIPQYESMLAGDAPEEADADYSDEGDEEESDEEEEE